MVEIKSGMGGSEMREIKYRVWEQRDNIMHSTPVITNRCFYVDHAHYEDDWSNRDDGGLELMQYTGLRDRNGVDVFESDKVEIAWEEPGGNWTEETGVVVWADLHGCFMVEINEDSAVGISDNDVLEVIGNIYENP